MLLTIWCMCTLDITKDGDICLVNIPILMFVQITK